MYLCLLFFFFLFFFHFIWNPENLRDRYRERLSLCWFTPQIPAGARNSARQPTPVSGPQVSVSSPTASRDAHGKKSTWMNGTGGVGVPTWDLIVCYTFCVCVFPSVHVRLVRFLTIDNKAQSRKMWSWNTISNGGKKKTNRQWLTLSLGQKLFTEPTVKLDSKQVIKDDPDGVKCTMRPSSSSRGPKTGVIWISRRRISIN